MAKKTTIGLGLFFNNQTNSGIVNYIYNIVAALNKLPKESQPNIILLHSEDAEIALIKEINYDKILFLKHQKYPNNLLLRIHIRFLEILFTKNYYQIYRLGRKICCFYPYFPFLNEDLKDLKNKIEWLVDFNNLAFPMFYDDKGVYMTLYQKKLTESTQTIVLSSNSLFDELKHYYPNFKNKVKILRFACSLPNLSKIDANSIKEKHKVDKPYFMSPNQFWEHKNQIVVLKAIKILKEKRPELKFKVLFTGSLSVNRGKGLYIEKLRSSIYEYEIEDYVQFLGVLERKEQLILMKESLSLIQPSLYEGWSTLVEEAKALNKFILLSNLPVHQEQIQENCYFFEPHNDLTLSELMEKVLDKKVTISNFDYEQNIIQYGMDILDAFTTN
ncbi:MAG: glycosyltransferase [Sphingobacteriales bacterium]|nr:glycosyltransferase [Sphingobacteriales bacterium]